MPPLPPDEPVRERALDPARSFIVQAPAGSGKTGLLIQRYLTLLATVENPEEVVAVTFTRKAAGEMRERILMALENAQENTHGEVPLPSTAPEVLCPFDDHTRQLAKKAVARDADLGWNIRSYPARLRIQTIDSLCAAITRMAPWQSRLGGEHRTLEDAIPLYRQTVRDLMDVLDAQGPWSDALARVLDFLDNDLSRFEATLVRMLARRDQWLRHVVSGGATEANQRRAQMIEALADIVTAALTRLWESIPEHLIPTILEVASYAGDHIPADSGSPISALTRLETMPGNSPEELPIWQGLAELLLTKAGKWRSRHTKNEGLPAPLPAHIKEMLANLKEDLTEAEKMRIGLHGVRLLPTGGPTDRQWQVLDALMTVLRLASASLRLVFARQGVVDFIEVAQGALTALGEEEDPSDLALQLDYRIRHLLVDEFQDTSHAQVRLFTGLTAGWQPGDGRTLFLVGDPMQSIYRFREADVALYLRARESGIGHIPLEPLTLSANFRSDPAIVHWLNGTFPLVFPGADDPEVGAVSFSPSRSGKAEEIGQEQTPDETKSATVSIHPYLWEQRQEEAWQVVALVKAALAADPNGSVAIIVRGRNHLDQILPALDAAGIPYRGVDLAPLANRSVVRDLLALTRALLHPGDRIAWLAVLRAPWCGLTIHDLYILAAADFHAPILEELRTRVVQFSSESSKGYLSAEGRKRLARVLPVLDAAVKQRSRRNLRATVETVWTGLGGPWCIEEAERPDAEAFLALLEKLEAEEEAPDASTLTRKVDYLYAAQERERQPVELMTIHKAKGLEFDTVIVPGLGRTTRSGENPLLAWEERQAASKSDRTGEFQLLVAPMPGPGEDADPTYQYLCAMEKNRGHNEAARLLYVATTRARKRLHLLGQVRISTKTGEVLPPDSRSLLFHLWPAVGHIFTDPTATHLSADSERLPEDMAQATASIPFQAEGDRAVQCSWSERRFPVNDVDPPWFIAGKNAVCRPGERRSREALNSPAGGEELIHPEPLSPLADIENKQENQEADTGIYTTCLPADWRAPPPPAPVPWPAHYLPDVTTTPTEPIEFQWAGHTARSVGTIIHRTLKQLAENGIQPDKIEDHKNHWRSTLLGLGVAQENLDGAVERVAEAILRVTQDRRWHWIADASHRDAHNEYALTGLVRGQLVEGIIDRTFLDAEGVRWIIDYKTGVHEGGNREEFLDRELIRYRGQLERYGALLAGRQRLEGPMRAGLYFPLLEGWRSWEIGG